LANVRYASGLSAYFEVLEAQQQLFPAEIGLPRRTATSSWRS